MVCQATFRRTPLAGFLSDPDLLARPFARPVDRRHDVVGVLDSVLGRIEFNQIDHIEARAAEQAEQLAVRQLPLHPDLAWPLESPEPALRPLEHFSR